MPSVCRIGDSNTCLGQATTGSSDVFVNGIGVHRVDDTNSCGVCAPPASAPLTSGSPNVFANGKKIGRIGDANGCPSTMTSGSGNVFANG